MSVLKHLKNDTSGAITLDWLVLTAAIIGFAVVILSSLSTAIYDPYSTHQAQTTEIN